MHITEWPEPDPPGRHPVERLLPSAFAPELRPLRIFGRALARRRARAVAVAEVASLPDGALARVTGRVRLLAPLTGLVDPRPAACRRVRLVLEIWPHVHRGGLRGGNRFFLHEAAVDFDLVDGRRAVRIEVARAHLQLPWPRHARVDDDAAMRLLRLPLPGDLRKSCSAAAIGRVLAAESLLAEGALVEVVGEKHRIAGMPEGERLDRELPTRPALRASARGALHLRTL